MKIMAILILSLTDHSIHEPRQNQRLSIFQMLSNNNTNQNNNKRINNKFNDATNLLFIGMLLQKR